MKSSLIALALAACAAGFPGHAEEPAQEDGSKSTPSATLTAECQIVTLPQKLALKLLPDLIDSGRINAAYDRLQTMIASGEAKLIDHLIAKAQEGTKAVAESVDEMTFPTEWEPPNLPDLKDIPKADIATVVKNWPLVGFQPTAFETRNLGPQLEFEPLSHSAGGDTFKITVQASDTRLQRLDFFSAGKTPSGEKAGMEKPRFHSIKNSATLDLQSGQRTLLGSHKLPGKDEIMELFLLRLMVEKAVKP